MSASLLHSLGKFCESNSLKKEQRKRKELLRFRNKRKKTNKNRTVRTSSAILPFDSIHFDSRIFFFYLWFLFCVWSASASTRMAKKWSHERVYALKTNMWKYKRIAITVICSLCEHLQIAYSNSSFSWHICTSVDYLVAESNRTKKLIIFDCFSIELTRIKRIRWISISDFVFGKLTIHYNDYAYAIHCQRSTWL